MNHAGFSTTARAPQSVVRRMTRALGTLTAACALAAGLSSCATGDMDMYDPASGATREDYKSMIGRRGQDKADAAKASEAPPIPAFQSVLAAPSAPELADTRRVSLAVTETTPVRDILIELARKAEVDLELDPRISGGIVMSVTDRPFIDVIDRVTQLAELRYTFEKNVLKVELDDPYLEQYRMDVLNQMRTSTTTISSSTDAQSSSQAIGTSSASGGNNKSESQVSSKSTSDFWGGVKTSIQDILQNIQSRRGESSQIQAAFVPVVGSESEEEDQGKQKEVTAKDPKGMIAKAGAVGAGRQGKLDALTEEGLGRPGDGAAEGDADKPKSLRAGSGGGGGGRVAQANFSVNPQAGIITVFANKRQHAAIDKYLRAVKASVMQQVLIEAKILEITLNDQFRSGVNWQAFLGPNNDMSITTNFSRNVVTGDTGTPTLGVAWANSDQDLSIAASLVKQFGTVRTLSSPRITVLNNQAAILKVAQNQIFFDLNVTREDATTATGRDRLTVDSEIKSVPVGLIMNVQPVVDQATKRISMGLRPSITRITGYVSDPGVAVVVAQVQSEGGAPLNITSQIPIIETRELDSMITMDSGQTVVMGGLMQETSENSREGVPGAMDIPILGHAVSSNIRGSKVTELVIFIRATIVNDRDTIADEDIRLYKTFTPDPRPIAF